MKILCLPIALSCAAFAARTAEAQFTVTGYADGLFPNNLSTLSGSSAFGKDEIAGGSFSIHKIPNVRDAVYGNSNSWIGDSADSFIGISFGSDPISVGQFAFGRDNTGQFLDRTLGTYTLQYTTAPNPDASTPAAAWVPIGSVTHIAGDAGALSPSRRHAYNFAPVSATGMRLLTPNGAAIDELEFAPFAAAPLTLQMTSGTMTQATNIALDVNGGVAFAKDVINNGGFAAHSTPHLNDGIYGNANSWIGDTEDSFAGVRFAAPTTIERLAFGRDNTGQFADRSDGYYLVQYTTAANPNASTADSEWTNLGPAFIDPNEATRALRHEYSFSPVAGATALRIITPGNGLADGRAIDELEVYAVPEPGSAALACVGLAVFFRRQRRT